MANAWYYSVAGKQVGPVSGDVLRQMAAAGALGREDLVRADDMQQWVPARTVKGLFPEQLQIVPPPAPALPRSVETGQSIAAKKSYKLPIIIVSTVVLVVAGVVIGVLLTKSGGSDASLSKACVGTWTASFPGGMSITKTYGADGKYAIDLHYHDSDGEYSIAGSGTWKVANGFLVMGLDPSKNTMTNDKSGKTVPCSLVVQSRVHIDRERVVSCNEVALVLEDDKGQRAAYNRSGSPAGTATPNANVKVEDSDAALTREIVGSFTNIQSNSEGSESLR